MAKKQKRDLYRPEEFDEVEEGPSRSQLKREMHALQQLGANLAALGDKVIKEAGLPADVEKALLLIKKLTKHEARRRHMQYVGKLMRTFDTTHVSEIVEAAKAGHTIKTAEFHRLEKVREQLIDGDDTLLQELFDTYPDQGQRLRQLVLGARREKAKGKPPKDSRALFKLLRQLPPPAEN
ncbi:ribosome biogenesis factor YjgA [uncultured Pseudodesulfovibrio sp.]|uniref:ribosome biogenesis factor YjgA n=1 Tax=uncultured Pseudodesulfovibrio sp. TaxID=2035858 RepID=UPI0029C63D86|nr:ribosome biogenesis factor YjgA [uncultured Pseudodesulfovibrio sp.]